jgi:hypothetical protein
MAIREKIMSSATGMIHKAKDKVKEQYDYQVSEHKRKKEIENKAFETEKKRIMTKNVNNANKSIEQKGIERARSKYEKKSAKPNAPRKSFGGMGLGVSAQNMGGIGKSEYGFGSIKEKEVKGKKKSSYRSIFN